MLREERAILSMFQKTLLDYSVVSMITLVQQLYYTIAHDDDHNCTKQFSMIKFTYIVTVDKRPKYNMTMAYIFFCANTVMF